MEFLIWFIPAYYIIGLLMVGCLYWFVRVEYGGIEEFFNLLYGKNDATCTLSFKLCLFWLAITVMPFIVPIAFVRGKVTEWRDPY